MTGAEPGPAAPSAGQRRKSRGKKRTQEVNKRRTEPHRAVECGLYPADVKTHVMLLVTNRRSKAGNWRPGRGRKFPFHRQTLWIQILRNKNYLKLFLEMIRLPALSQAVTGFWVSRRGSGWSCRPPCGRCLRRSRAHNSGRYPMSTDVSTG